MAVAERAHSQRWALAGFGRSRACVAGRRIIRVWARHVSRCVSNIQSQWERSGAGDVEIFARGLPADPAGMGLDRRNPLGAALLRRNNSQHSWLQRARQTRVDAAKTRATAVGYHSAYRSGAARAGRFPRSDRIDRAVCGNVPGFVLGEQVVARKVQLAAKIKLWFKIKTRCKAELIAID